MLPVRVLLTMLLLAARLASAAAPAAMVLESGRPSPLGLPFSAFPAVAADDQGRVVLLGTSTGAFHRDASGIVHVLAAGDVLPSGSTVAGISAAAVDAAGCVALSAFLVGGGSILATRSCAGRPDGTLLATGAPAPGGGTIVDIGDTVAVAGPHIAFAVLLDDGRTALLRATGSTLARIAVVGNSVPGGGTFTALRLAGVTAAGRVGFRGSVTGANDGLFAGDGGDVVALVRIGDAVGGLGVGGSLNGLGGASLNETDRWAFRGSLSTRTGTLGAVFRIDASRPSPDVQMVAVEGGITPSDGVTFRSFTSSIVPSINRDGAIAFRANLEGAEGGSAIFVSPPGEPLIRIVATRDPTPVGSLVRFRDPAIADDGSLCIPASITGQGPGLYVHTQFRGGSLLPTPLAQLGDPSDVDTGLERFRFSAPAVGASAAGAIFIGSREGIFRVASDGTVETLAFVGGPTPLNGTYAVFDPPAAGGGAAVFGAEIRGGRASRALIRVTSHGGPHVVAAATARGPGRGHFVDFFAGAIDSVERADVGPRDDVAFEATMQGGRFARGVFRRAGARVGLVAGVGRRAPGGGTYQNFGTPAVVRGTTVAFVAQVDDGGSRVDTLVLQRGGRGSRVASKGDAVGGRLAGHVSGLDAPDATDRMVVWRGMLEEQAREGLFARALRRGATGLLVGTGDPAPEGGAFRGFERPVGTRGGIVFLGRLQGSLQSPALYLVRATEAPAPDAGPLPVERLLGPGSAAPAPLGGQVADVIGVDANRVGTVVVSAELVDATAHAAVLVVPTLP